MNTYQYDLLGAFEIALGEYRKDQTDENFSAAYRAEAACRDAGIGKYYIDQIIFG